MPPPCPALVLTPPLSLSLSLPLSSLVSPQRASMSGPQSIVVRARDSSAAPAPAPAKPLSSSTAAPSAKPSATTPAPPTTTTTAPTPKEVRHKAKERHTTRAARPVEAAYLGRGGDTQKAGTGWALPQFSLSHRHIYIIPAMQLLVCLSHASILCLVLCVCVCC